MGEWQGILGQVPSGGLARGQHHGGEGLSHQPEKEVFPQHGQGDILEFLALFVCLGRGEDSL